MLKCVLERLDFFNMVCVLSVRKQKFVVPLLGGDGWR